MKLLIDENLSPSLVQRLAARGVAAVHVAHIGMPGATDPDIWSEHQALVAAGLQKFAPPGDPNMGTNLRTFTAVMQWQEGGKFVTVYPKELAAGPVQYIPLRKWSERK